VIEKTAKINFKTFPVYPTQFAILKVESKKKENLLRRARQKARLPHFGDKEAQRAFGGLRALRASSFLSSGWHKPLAAQRAVAGRQQFIGTGP